MDVLGVRVSAINPESAVDQVKDWIEGGQREYVCVTGVHGVVESLQHPDLIRIHNEAGMVTPDGMPLVWCSRIAGADWVERVYGPDLLLDLCEESLQRGWSHFFYGAAPGVADRLAARLTKRFPGLKVVGTHSPPFRDLDEGEVDDVVDMINLAAPTIVWVGLSTPKQERWMSSLRDRLNAPVIVGVGAAFDMHAGDLRQAPPWMQRAGLEWLFRVMMEPKRLWKRYVRAVPTFLVRIATNRPTFVPGELPASRP